ncbi:MAG: flavodoxin family protein [Pseudomonadota bacterium]
MYQIVGLSASPVKDSNAHLFLKQALEPHLARDDAQITLIEAGQLRIEDCTHCNHCLLKQTPDRLCSVEDDMLQIYQALIPADALILATPVYFGRLSGYMARIIDRLRAVHYGQACAGRMKNKVGAGLAVAWYRHGGLETTLMTLAQAFFTLDMIVAAPGCFGGMGVTSLGGDGTFDVKDRHQVLKDEYGISLARRTVDRVFELVEMVRKVKD